MTSEQPKFITNDLSNLASALEERDINVPENTENTEMKVVHNIKEDNNINRKTKEERIEALGDKAVEIIENVIEDETEKKIADLEKSANHYGEIEQRVHDLERKIEQRAHDLERKIEEEKYSLEKRASEKKQKYIKEQGVEKIARFDGNYPGGVAPFDEYNPKPKSKLESRLSPEKNTKEKNTKEKSTEEKEFLKKFEEECAIAEKLGIHISITKNN